MSIIIFHWYVGHYPIDESVASMTPNRLNPPQATPIFVPDVSQINEAVTEPAREFYDSRTPQNVLIPAST
jgi:hypothetical protein